MCEIVFEKMSIILLNAKIEAVAQPRSLIVIIYDHKMSLKFYVVFFVAEMMELWPNSSSIQEELDTTETSRLTGLSSDTSTSDPQVILIILRLLSFGSK